MPISRFSAASATSSSKLASARTGVAVSSPRASGSGAAISTGAAASAARGPPRGHFGARFRPRRHVGARRRLAAGCCAGAVAPRTIAERADHLVRRRQVGGVGDPHQHHLGRGERPAGGGDLFEPFEQHLPGARQNAHRELCGKARPRVRSASVSETSSASAGTIFTRVTKCVNSARSPSTIAGSAPASYCSRIPQRARQIGAHQRFEQVDDLGAVGKAEHLPHVLGAHRPAVCCVAVA